MVSLATDDFELNTVKNHSKWPIRYHIILGRFEWWFATLIPGNVLIYPGNWDYGQYVSHPKNCGHGSRFLVYCCGLVPVKSIHVCQTNVTGIGTIEIRLIRGQWRNPEEYGQVLIIDSIFWNILRNMVVVALYCILLELNNEAFFYIF